MEGEGRGGGWNVILCNSGVVEKVRMMFVFDNASKSDAMLILIITESCSILDAILNLHTLRKSGSACLVAHVDYFWRFDDPMT